MSNKGNPINWFEIPVNDMDRAKAFYQTVFELEIAVNEMGANLMGWFPAEQGVPGATGALVKGDGYNPSDDGSLVYFKVDSIEEALKRIEANGGKMRVPKTDIGEYGFFAHFEDCEGNRVALHALS